MHRKSGSQFCITGIRIKRSAPEPLAVQSDIDEVEVESPKSKRKRIKDNDTVENDRHKDDVFTEKKRKGTKTR